MITVPIPVIMWVNVDRGKSRARGIDVEAEAIAAEIAKDEMEPHS
jgi:hypothetical protein